MRNSFINIALILLLAANTIHLAGQETPNDSVTVEEEITESFLYKPVIGFGTGVFNYFGEVTDNFQAAISGPISPKISVSSYLDRARRINLEFFYLSGVITGNQSKPGEILNWKSDITNFGINLHLSLRDFMVNKRALSPYIGIGIESVRFNSKGDLLNANDSLQPYTFVDGNILDSKGNLTARDYIYETDLREKDLYGYGKYPETSFGIPLDVGIDLALSERISLRFGTSFHFFFSDYVDNQTSNDVGLLGNRGDMFTNAYVSMHVDLFNMPAIMNLPKFFVEAEYDEIMSEDEDGDKVLDFFDQCPFTPFGAEVDSDGCPLDDDQDGVSDFMDKELNTPYGAFINDDGVQLTEDELIALYTRQDAVYRADLVYYLNHQILFSRYSRGSGEGVPDKFMSFDKDEDGIISFEELLQSIDAFFDFSTFLSEEDIYEFVGFFFTQ